MKFKNQKIAKTNKFSQPKKAQQLKNKNKLASRQKQ